MLGVLVALMVMLWEIQMKVFISLDFGFQKTWEYDLKIHYLILDLHNFLVSNNHDRKNKCPSYYCTFT
jgi:hypothetical protein